MPIYVYKFVNQSNCNNFQCFLFKHWLMKNPFTNTADYMIVRQFQRLNTKKRSISNGSQSSAWSSQSSKMGPYQHARRDSISSSRYDREYLAPKIRPKLYQIQSKRAQVFGLQQLRYKPAYFQGIASDYITQQSRQEQKIQSTEKKIISPGLKSQKSLKQLRFSSCQKKQISEKKVLIQEKDRIKQQKKLQFGPTALKKRASVVEQMIQLNLNNNARSNQFYSSIADLKSRHELLRLNSNESTHNNRTKKSSIFHSQYEHFEHQNLMKRFKNEQQEQQQSQRSKLTESKRFQEAELSVNQIQESDPPDCISIRGRVYFRYSKPNY